MPKTPSRPLLDTAGSRPQITYNVSDNGSPYKVAYAQFLALVAQMSFAPGASTGFVRSMQQTRSDAAELVPDGWSVIGDWDYGEHLVLAKAADDSLAFLQGDSGSAYLAVEVFSPHGVDAAKDILNGIMAGMKPLDPVEDGLEVAFWFMTSMGPSSIRRTIEASDWVDVAGNYPSGLRASLDEMVRWKTLPAGGRLILTHGPPGSGKTRFQEVIAREWRSWADIHVITDPTEFFDHSSYMLQVLLGDDRTDRYRLIIVEDCDEILTANARDRSGHAVSKLLNVADGMVGQGLKIALMLSTNETVDAFHPAILRPGRCLSNLFFGGFDADEANGWRAEHGLPEGGGATLAELYGEVRQFQRSRASRVSDTLRTRSTVV